MAKKIINVRHGHVIGGKPTRIYRIWEGMRDRCNNPNNPRYSRYGGRGIKVCKRWDVFENFLADMVEVPSHRHSIDRIDNDGDYSPENCRWATDHQQSRNHSRNRFFTHDGKTMCLKDWAMHVGVNVNTLRQRLERGITFADAIKPTDSVPTKNKRLITFNGKTQSLSAWAREIGIKPVSLYNRLQRGWPLEKALHNGPVDKVEYKSVNALTFNGKTMGVCDWARETGIPQATISSRLSRGWSVERALTHPTTPSKQD